VSTANRTRGVARLCAVPGTLLRPTPAGLRIALCVLTHPVRCPWDACAQQAFAVGHGAGPRRGHGCRQAGAADSIGSASAMTRRAASSSRSGGRRARSPAAAGPPRSTSRVPSPLVTASGHRLPARDVPRWILVEGEDQAVRVAADGERYRRARARPPASTRSSACLRRRAPAARAGSGHDADVQPRNHLAVHQAGRERDLPIRRQQGPVDDRFAAPRAAPTAREGDLLTGPDDVVFHRTGLHPTSHADLTTTRQRELARQEGGIGPRSDPAFS